MTRMVYLCGADDRLIADTSNCPNNAEHEPSPGGYLEWHAWAKEMNKTHKNVKCPGCGLYKLWMPRAAKAAS